MNETKEFIERKGEIIKEAKEIRIKALARKDSQYTLAYRYKLLNRYFGSASTLLSAIVGTAIFGAFKKEDVSDGDYNTIKLIVGIVSIAATGSTALLTFGKFSQKAELCKKSSNAYEAVSGDINTYLHKYNVGNPSKFQFDEAIKDLDSIKKSFQKVNDSASTVFSDKLYEKMLLRYYEDLDS